MNPKHKIYRVNILINALLVLCVGSFITIKVFGASNSSKSSSEVKQKKSKSSKSIKKPAGMKESNKKSTSTKKKTVAKSEPTKDTGVTKIQSQSSSKPNKTSAPAKTFSSSSGPSTNAAGQDKSHKESPKFEPTKKPQLSSNSPFDNAPSEQDVSPDLFVWLIPIGFFSMAGLLVIFQKYQHLLIRGKPVQEKNRELRPESRAEVALGSVLASLDLDTSRAEENIAPIEPGINRQKSRQNSPHEYPESPGIEQQKTRVSGNKPKILTDKTPSSTHREATTAKSSQGIKRNALSADAVLEPSAPVNLNLSGLDSSASPIQNAENSSEKAKSEPAFLTAAPSAMNWVGNPVLGSASNEDDPALRIKNASGYQNSVQKTNQKKN